MIGVSLALRRHAGDRGIILVPQVSNGPAIFPDRDNQRRYAAGDQREAEQAECLGEAGRGGRGHLVYRSKNWTMVKPKAISETAVRTHA